MMCVITYNRAMGNKSNGYGGGLACTSGSNVNIVQCTIIDNKAAGGDSAGSYAWNGYGGGIYGSGQPMRGCGKRYGR